MDYSAWGVSWLGSWGDSWGPLHAVEENPWDTDQGVARNLARNLKFSRIDDVSVRAVGGGSLSSSAALDTWASASATATGGGSYSGAQASASGTAVSCNGFAVPTASGVYSGFSEPDAAAEVNCAPVPAPSIACGCSTPSVSAEAVAIPQSGVSLSGCAQPGVLAIHNPSDEELATIALLIVKNKLLTRKQYGRLRA